MADNKSTGVHWSFWLIGAIALIWNLMGVANFVAQMSPDAVASMPETHRAIIDTRPAWATGGFAIAVFGGAIGCLLLLLKKSAAFYLFVASLLGVVITMVHTLQVASSGVAFMAFEIGMMIMSPLAVALLLLWYAKRAQKRGWTM